VRLRKDRNRQASGRRPRLDVPRRRRFSSACQRDAFSTDGGIVVGCSALARRYRERLGLPHPLIRLVHLDGAADTIRKRLEQRAGHFMPTTLLESQFAILERPTAEERAIVVDVAAEPDAIVRRISAAVLPR